MWYRHSWNRCTGTGASPGYGEHEVSVAWAQYMGSVHGLSTRAQYTEGLNADSRGLVRCHPTVSRSGGRTAPRARSRYRPRNFRCPRSVPRRSAKDLDERSLLACTPLAYRLAWKAACSLSGAQGLSSHGVCVRILLSGAALTLGTILTHCSGLHLRSLQGGPKSGDPLRSLPAFRRLWDAPPVATLACLGPQARVLGSFKKSRGWQCVRYLLPLRNLLRGERIFLDRDISCQRSFRFDLPIFSPSSPDPRRTEKGRREISADNIWDNLDSLHVAMSEENPRTLVVKKAS